MPYNNLLAMLLVLWSALATAQGAIFESKGKDGPVFSDLPVPGAKPLDLPPVNVIDSAPIAPAPSPAPPRPEPAPPAYTQLLIVSPGDEGTIHTNTGDFDLLLQIDPALAVGNGDAIRVRLDGHQLAKKYDHAQIHVGEADWASAADPDNIEHRLQVTITDRSGAVLIESAPIRFYAHHASGR